MDKKKQVGRMMPSGGGVGIFLKVKKDETGSRVDTQHCALR